MASNSLSCPFCSERNAVIANQLAYVRRDNFPVSPGHLLVIPLRHVEDFFEMTTAERAAVMELLVEAKAMVKKDHAPDGYNVGVNVGEAAGQSIRHVHVHLIPRYKGDVPNPRGGVRGVIPLRQDY